MAAAKANKIDVIVVDPFVTTHRVNENDNASVERVAKSWSKIAEAANCSVMLVHHSRKTGGEAATVDEGARRQRPAGGGQDRALAQHHDGPGGQARRGRRARAAAPLPLRPRQDQPLATGGGGLLVQDRLGGLG